MEYTNENRGVIQNRERARQLINFSGIKFGNITPTDVDGACDYKDKLTMFFEVKYGNAVPPPGQKLFYIRTADDIQKSGKSCIVYFCWHDIANPEDDIDGAKTEVKYIYFKGQWYTGSCELLEAVTKAITATNNKRKNQWQNYSTQ